MDQKTIDTLRNLYHESTNELAKQSAKKKLEQAGIPLTESAKSEGSKMDQKTIDTLRNLYNESTNELAKQSAKKKLMDAGVSLTESEGKSEPKAKAKKPKAEPKPKSEPKAKAESKSTAKDDYDCDDLIKKEKERKAKAKANSIKRANAPKKTPTTKNKEAVQKTATKVEKSVETRAKKGQVKVAELEKLISEYEQAIKRLKALLSKVKSGKKFAQGGNMGMMNTEHSNEYHKIKDHHCKCNDKMEHGGDIGMSHYVVNGEVFIDYMDAMNYCDRNKLSYNKIKKTKKYPSKMAEGGNIDDIRQVAEKNGLSKGTLMKLAYGDNTRGVDSAIPRGLLEEMGIPNSEYYHYVMDYQKNKFGELVDLFEKISSSNLGNKISKLNSMSDSQLAKIFEDVYGFDSNDVLIEIQGNEQERKDLIRQLVESPKFLKHNNEMAKGGQLPKEGKLVLQSYTVDIYEDDYNEGEGKMVNYWDERLNKEFDNGKDLLDYIKNSVVYSEDAHFHIDEEGYLYGNLLVDSESVGASKTQIERWKKGDEKLFSANYRFIITIVQEETLSQEELSEILGVDMYAKGGKVKEINLIDRHYRALPKGRRTSEKIAQIDIRGGGTFTRRNANQYGKTKGGNTYYEYHDNRSDDRGYLENGGNIEKKDSLMNFVQNEMSSSMVANKCDYSDYKTIDKIKAKMISILKKDGDRKYSITATNNLVKEAVKELGL